VIDTGDATVDALIDGLLDEDNPRDTSEIKYTFELSSSLILDQEYDPLGEEMIQRHLSVFAEIAALTGLTFREVSPIDEPDFFFANRVDVSTAYVISHLGGILHVYNPERDDPQLGSYQDHLVLHEVGHGLGLEHGHGIGRMPSAYQGHSWSVMSYRAHPDTDSLFYTDSHGPETYMLADVAAIQFLYGANYETASGDTEYTVDFETGEFFIDGVGQGEPVNNETLRTVWDGGGTDTLNLSNAESSLRIDLRPGEFTSFGPEYVAYQGEGPFGNNLYAAGNIANAYLYQGNTASLLENAIGGQFNDTIIGNVIDNVLDGGAGDDSLFGLVGNDSLIGGMGNDLIVDGIGITDADGGEGEDFIAALSGESDLSGGLDGDILIGGIDDDKLTGGSGNDVLRGDAGRGVLFGSDTLIGGDGDEFGSVADVVANGADFQSGIDKIGLREFTTVDADNVLDFILPQDETEYAVFNAEGTSITFYGLNVDAISAEDFLFL